MQQVSQSWKDTHKQTLLNESFVEVSLDIADPDSIKDASDMGAVSNGSIYISETSEIVSEVDTNVIPYGTLEQNIYLLDGSRKNIPETDYKDGGYIGDVLSNAECIFDSKTPVITINFSRVHTKIVPGVTIKWGTAYNEYASHFIVTAYNGDTVVAEEEVIDNQSVTSIITMDIVNYNRIEIRILSWCLPNRRARVDEIFIGINKVYSKKDLLSYNHSQVVDPISTSLPKMEIKFSIDNSDNSYNPYNLSGLAKYITERQELKTRYGLKLNDNTIEWIKGGTFYLSEWYAKQNGISAEFVARDLLEFMSATCDDAEYDGSERTLGELAELVLSKANLPKNSDGTNKWVIGNSLYGIKTNAMLPKDTLANCLQVIANMGCCVLYQDRDGVLHIEPINNTSIDYTINQFNSYSKSEITLSKLIKQVIVKVYTYTIVEGEIQTKTEDYVLTKGDTGEDITIDNPLVTDTNRANVLGEWVYGYLENRITLKSVSRADVRLDALDIVSNENDYATNNVRMTNVDFTFNGAFRGTGEGRVI